MKFREFTIQDAARVAILAGDESISRWTTNIPFPYNEADAVSWIVATSNNPSRRPFAIEVCNEIVGCISYWPYDADAVEVGYWVGTDYWGKGICSAALQSLINLDSFPKHMDIVAKVMKHNLASEKVLEKCGFKFYKQCVIKKLDQEIDGKYFIKKIKA